MSLLHQVALTFVKNIGPTLAKSLIAHFGSAEEVFTAPSVKLLKIPGIGEKTVSQLDFGEALEKAEKELQFTEKNGIDMIFYTDSKFPKRLKNCNDSPILLYSKGNADLNAQRIVSIVGTRNATDYGKQLCRDLVDELQQNNVLVVSGLALGIDVAVHKECVKLNVPT
ncbi:MAG TPA: DNA-processing protein DprA, partial [Mucilaginibacter sp.]